MPEDPEPAQPTGARAVEHVAASMNPDAEVTANALAFFMGDEPPPGRDDLIRLAVDFGKPDEPDMRLCVFRPLGHEEFVAASIAARVVDADSQGGKRIDPFLNASFVFAYACVQPDLSVALARRRERGDKQPDGTPFTDTAAVVRDVFRYREGPLQAVSAMLDRESRNSEEADKLVRQIEAGKESR